MAVVPWKTAYLGSFRLSRLWRQNSSLRDGGIGSMATITTRAGREETAALTWGVYLMTLGAIAFMGYAIIFLVLNFTGSFLELGIGSDQVASGKDEIKAFDNDLYHYISHLHIAISGFIASTGLAVAALSWFGVRRRYMWSWVAAVAAPVLALAVALPAHYPWGFDTIGHLGPIYLATAIFVVGALLALRELIGESEASDLQRE
jgi:hypothetical protein